MVTQKKKSGYLTGSTVIEAAYLFPVIMIVWMLILYALFYYHDKHILSGAAYEAAVVGSELKRDREQEIAGDVERYARERIRGKLIFFPGAQISVEEEKKKIIVTASAHAKWMWLTVAKSAAVTKPEKEIRKLRIAKQQLEDIKGERE